MRRAEPRSINITFAHKTATRCTTSPTVINSSREGRDKFEAVRRQIATDWAFLSRRLLYGWIGPIWQKKVKGTATTPVATAFKIGISHRKNGLLNRLPGKVSFSDL